MFIDKKAGAPRVGALLCAIISLGLLATASLASQSLVQDRRITLEEASNYADNAAKSTRFPIILNDAVLSQLNLYLGTPDGRAYMRDALERMKEHRLIIEKIIQEYGVPRALMAIPLVESGYRNLRQSNEMKSAGLWQFIETTANHYGITVDDAIDQRLDVELETDAAIRYLLANNLRFRDWGLSVLAYNAGASTVQKGIDATGSRDPWVLVEAGYENDKDYLGKVVAALIIMLNPSSLE